MSVYKEDWYFLEQVIRQQVMIYTDAADCGIPVKSGNPQLGNTLHNLRVWLKQNREFATVKTTGDFKTGGSGSWEFSYPMIEAIEDGRQIGYIGVVTFIRDKSRNVEFVNIQLRDPNRR